MVSGIPSPVLKGILKLIGTGPFFPHFRANVKFSCVLLGWLYPYTSFGIECRHGKSARGYAFGACENSGTYSGWILSHRQSMQREGLEPDVSQSGASVGYKPCWSSLHKLHISELILLLNLMRVQVPSPAELFLTRCALPLFFFCLLTSNEFTIKACCKISSKLWIKVSLVPLQQNN